VIKKFAAVNIVSAATLRGIRKLRSELCFQNAVWLNVKQLIWRIAGLAHIWLIPCPAEKKKELKSYILRMHSWARRPEMMMLIKSLSVKQWAAQLKKLEEEMSYENEMVV
jgi:hypothetical protein